MEVWKKSNKNFVFWFSLMKSVLIKPIKLRKEKYIIYSSCNKKAPGSEMELNPLFKEINRLRKWWSQGKIPPFIVFFFCLRLQLKELCRVGCYYMIIVFILTFNLEWTTIQIWSAQLWSRSWGWKKQAFVLDLEE